MVRFYRVLFCSIIILRFVLSMDQVFYNTSAFEKRKLLSLKHSANNFEAEFLRFNTY